MLRNLLAEPAAPPPSPPPLDFSSHRNAVEANASQLDAFASSIIWPLPKFVLMFMHYTTSGAFTFFWITSLHKNLPKFKEDDPTGSQAIWFSFIPIYQIFWIFFSNIRLIDRVNVLCRRYRVPECNKGFVYIGGILNSIWMMMGSIGAVVLSFLAFSHSSETFQTSLNIFVIAPSLLMGLNLAVVLPLGAFQIQECINNVARAQLFELTK